jgi:hypothetical protein
LLSAPAVAAPAPAAAGVVEALDPALLAVLAERVGVVVAELPALAAVLAGLLVAVPLAGAVAGVLLDWPALSAGLVVDAALLSGLLLHAVAHVLSAAAVRINRGTSFVMTFTPSAAPSACDAVEHVTRVSCLARPNDFSIRSIS